jgi:ankyrin repeat protein
LGIVTKDLFEQFQIYNTVLRRFPKPVYDQFEVLGNLFETTIYVLVSAVQKIARVMKLQEGVILYRGLGGNMKPPSEFWKSDEKGRKGIAEWGFMSTTRSREVAVQYSGVKEGRPHAMLFEIQVSSVDRGACIREFSQYPGEEEYLWVPCSFLEPSGEQSLEVTKDGVLKVVRVRVNANLKALTVEDMTEAKKRAHLASFRYLIDEVSRDIHKRAVEGRAEERWRRDNSSEDSKAIYTVKNLLSVILGQCRKVLETHEKVNAEDYNRSESFRSLVIEMLEVRAMAASKLDLWLEDEGRLICFDTEKPMRVAHRKRIAYLELQLPLAEGEQLKGEALALCKAKGLVHAGVDDTNDLGEVRLVSAAAEDVSCRNLLLLVKAGADLDAADGAGETALMKAATYGHVDAVRALVGAGADVKRFSKKGGTAVSFAATEGQAECVRALAELKADVDAKDEKQLTALYYATQQGQTECVRALLELKADPGLRHWQGKGGLTLVHVAAYHAHAECLRELLRAGVDPDVAEHDHGQTAAMYAAGRGYCACLRVLKDAGADLGVVDRKRYTALDWATVFSRQDCCEVLEGAARGRAGSKVAAGCC